MRRMVVVLGTVLALSGAAGAADAAFPGKNGKIAFTRHGAVYVVEPDGSGLRALTKETFSAPAQDPAWSPNGRRIAFARACGIYVMKADGSDVRTLVKAAKLCSYEPAWSPDGKRIVFVKRKDLGNAVAGAVYVMNANGSGQRAISQKQMTKKSFDDAFPQWSPDGRRIAFARNDRTGTIPVPAVWVMNADGGRQARLTKEKVARSEGMPVWSPDGKQIAYMKMRQRGLQEVRQITVADATTGAQRDLPTGKLVLDHNPSWSPDGRRVAFVAGGIYTLSVDGTDRRQVTNSADDEAPDWQPLP